MERENEIRKTNARPTGKYARAYTDKEIGSHVSERERKKAHFLNSLTKKTTKEKEKEVTRHSIKKKVRELEKSKHLKRDLPVNTTSKGKYVGTIIADDVIKTDEESEDSYSEEIKESVKETNRVAELSVHSVYVRKVSKDRKKKTKNKDEPYRMQNNRTVTQRFKSRQEKSRDSVQTFEETKQKVIRVVARIKEALETKRSVVFIAAAVILSLVVLVSSVFTASVSVINGVGIYVLGLTMTEDINMTEAESYFAKKEMLLQERIDNIMDEFPDFDEYVFDLDEIEHDPFLLMAYLSSTNKGYTLSQVQGLLDSIFDNLYDLTLLEKVEERTRWVFDEESQEWVEETYEIRILYITLIRNDLESILGDLLTTEEKELFDIYKDTRGAHQSFQNPFQVNWRDYVSSAFGWRIHPISGSEKFHNGVDIALSTGTEVGSCSKGTVILSYYSESAGNYIVVEDESGYRCHYMHLDARYVSEGEKVNYGQIIGTVGNTGNSTGPHLHLGVQNEDREWINPLFVVSDYVR